MKDYQIKGLNWLIRAWHEGRNVVLADEMGLGKTIQTIAFLDHLYKHFNIKGPFLVVAPLTTLEHWKKIAEEWTGKEPFLTPAAMNTILYYDTKSTEGRSALRWFEWYHTDITTKGQLTQKMAFLKFNLLITSFEVFSCDL